MSKVAAIYGAYETRKARKDQKKFNNAQEARAAGEVEQAKLMEQEELDKAAAKDAAHKQRVAEGGRKSTFSTDNLGTRGTIIGDDAKTTKTPAVNKGALKTTPADNTGTQQALLEGGNGLINKGLLGGGGGNGLISKGLLGGGGGNGLISKVSRDLKRKTLLGGK